MGKIDRAKFANIAMAQELKRSEGGRMMKYQFEFREIKKCHDCPILWVDHEEHYRSDCSLGYKFDLTETQDAIVPLEVPVGCPLVKVESEGEW